MLLEVTCLFCDKKSYLSSVNHNADKDTSKMWSTSRCRIGTNIIVHGVFTVLSLKSSKMSLNCLVRLGRLVTSVEWL